MSRALSTAKKKSYRVLPSGELEKVPFHSPSSPTSLSQRTFNYTRRAGPPSVATSYKGAVMSSTTNAGTNSRSEPWMQTATPGQFKEFQMKIFEVIQVIVKKPENAHHPFTVSWTKLCKNPRNPMSADTSWRSVKNLLGLQDIFGYRDYIQQCPAITEYIKFAPSQATKTGFDFGVYDHLLDEENPVEAATLPSSSPSVDSPSTTGTESYIIDFTDHQFLDLANQKMPAKPSTVLEIAAPKDDHSSETRTDCDTISTKNEQLSLTPKQTNVNNPPNIVSVTTAGNSDSKQHDAIPDDADILWSATDESPDFRQTHYRMFETANMWYQQDSAVNHPFHLKWRKALYAGLQSTTKWERVAKILKLQYVKDYITFMKECPSIQEQYELRWDYFDNAIRYTELALPEIDVVNNDIKNLNVFQRQLQGMIIRFDAMFKDVEQRVDAVNLRTTACEENLLNRVSTRLANNVTQQMNNISRFASNTMESFTARIQATVDRQLLLHSENVAVIHQNSADRLEARIAALERKLTEQVEQMEAAFYERFDQAMEAGLQDINDTTDDAMDKFNQHVDAVTAQYNQKVEQMQQKAAADTDNVKTTTSRYNVDPAFRQHLENLTPTQPPDYDTKPSDSSPPTTAHGPTPTQHSNETDKTNEVPIDWGTEGPTIQRVMRPPPQQHWYPGYNNYYQQPNPDGLPMVQNNDFLKRVQLLYPGKEQSYTWYLQLKSNAQQYGIYLKDMQDFEKGKSLCPTTFYGVTIVPSRYHDMKTPLYHFLAQTTTISTDHHDVRNIVIKYALTTDGYRALYDIMKRIHPKLNPDATFDKPEIKNHADVHEYYLYINAYYMHEEYSNRHYTPREKLNEFLNGLDANYHPAISRIRGIMDGWPVTETRVPETLQFENLPDLVDQYMEESGTLPTIHRMQFNRGDRGDKSHREGTPKLDATARKWIDVQCPLCLSYGHTKTQCDRMAVWLNLKEGSKMVDEKLRGVLSKNYAKVDGERRAKKVARLKGTVRQLYSDGQFTAGERLLDDCLSKFGDMFTPAEAHDSESDQSHVE